MTETIQYVATCLFGLESLLGAEIEKLGYRRLDTMDGRVTFEGDRAAIARCNVGLRFAERLYLKMGSFRATTFDDLFEGTKAIAWEQYIGEKDAFPVRGHSIKSALFSVPDCQSIIKKAIVSRLGAKYGIRWFEESEVKYQIDFFLFKDEITLMIDTSGIPLHKRGYRPLANAAPLRETLAAAVASLARPREDVLFWDPFCGSGTIAVEAAMIMTNRAPGMNRYFDAERFPAFGKELFNEARTEAKDLVIRDSKFEVYASDIDPECVHIAIESAKHAGVYEQMKIFRADALTIKTGGRRGTVVCNPPYGERMMTLKEAETLYRKMGEHFKSLDRWQIYVLTSHDRFGNVYGRRPDKVRKLYNGMIPCYFYQFFKNDKV